MFWLFLNRISDYCLTNFINSIKFEKYYFSSFHVVRHPEVNNGMDIILTFMLLK